MLMSKTGRSAKLATFIVRVWERGRRTRRGQVEHVQTGTKEHFKDLEQLHEILKRGLEAQTEEVEPKKFAKAGARRS